MKDGRTVIRALRSWDGDIHVQEKPGEFCLRFLGYEGQA